MQEMRKNGTTYLFIFDKAEYVYAYDIADNEKKTTIQFVPDSEMDNSDGSKYLPL